ncbi:MAG: putative 2-aminoethylphosphonate ABC transporter permease subunit [Marinomonas sp.]
MITTKMKTTGAQVLDYHLGYQEQSTTQETTLASKEDTPRNMPSKDFLDAFVTIEEKREPTKTSTRQKAFALETNPAANQTNWLSFLNTDALIKFTLISLLSLMLFTFTAAPLFSMLQKSVLDSQGSFVALSNFIHYLQSPALRQSFITTLTLGFSVSGIVSVLAFVYAYAINRSCMPGKNIFANIALGPIFAPSLLPAISLIYLFGNQGLIKEVLLGHSIYGMIGTMIGLVFWCFPHAFMIINTALKTTDARLYEAASALKLSPIKTFFTVTLATAKYGLISAFMVVFTLAVCDFGVAKVIGGNVNVMATDIFKQVVGQQNFSMAAVTSVLLLLPALITFILDNRVQKKQQQLFSSNSIVYKPKPNMKKDLACFAFCSTIALLILCILGMALYASLVKFWPWNMSISLDNYQFSQFSVYGWQPYFTSLKLASLVAIIGALLIFVGAYLLDKGQLNKGLKQVLQMLCLLPMAVPGMVLGLGYIFFFNHPSNPLNLLYGTLAILVINTLVHYYTVGHLTALSALKQLPQEVESVAASLKVPQYKIFFKVTLPVCFPAILDIGIYLFINAMTTTSAIIFLYSSNTLPAAVAVLNISDTGNLGAAAAMASLIMLTCVLVKIVHGLLQQTFYSKFQAWRQPREPAIKSPLLSLFRKRITQGVTLK